jgi:nucleoside-diphosphate-sugar epimerase
MDIIITGTSGFVGRHLADYLKKNNHQVQNLSLRNADWERSVDLKAEVIIHLAGKAHDTANTSAASEYFKVNTDLSKSVFDIFLASNINDFFYFSSVKAVADTVDTVLTEEAIPVPKTPYGQSKLEAEHYILSQKPAAGKRVFIIRPCMIHGPGNKGNLNLLYKIVKKEIPYPLAAFENKRSFLSIENLNFLIQEMISHKEISSGVYNFADDESLSTNELVTLISKTVNKKSRLWKISKKLVVTIAKIGDLLHLPLNSERLKKMTESYVVSNDKIKKALRLSKLPVTAGEGLERTIKSFTENN